MSATPGVFADRLRGWRHNLHQIPETGLACYVNLARTALPAGVAT